MVKKILKILAVLLVVIIIAYFLGPKVEIPKLNTDLPTVTSDLLLLEKEISDAESKVENIRPKNESQIIWADSTKQKTEYAVVYLHGFSASPEEGAPIHKNFAKRYGYNIYLPRLYTHGLNTEKPLLDFTSEGFIKSAKKAVAVGKKLGEKVILMSASTGSTASLYITSGNPDIHSLIMFAPNVDLFSSTSSLMIKPWGKQLLKLVLGGEYQIWDAPEEAQNFWYTKYRYEAIPELKAMINVTMTNETFSKITQPVFTAYYYKNEEEQDKTISVKAIQNMLEEIKTPQEKIKSVAFPDAKTHIISSKYFSPVYQDVENETYKFAEEVLNLTPIENQ